MKKKAEVILKESGEMLYGSRFQTALGKSLGVDRRTIINWLSQAPPPGHDAWQRLDGLMCGRLLDIEGHRNDMDEMRGV